MQLDLNWLFFVMFLEQVYISLTVVSTNVSLLLSPAAYK